MIEPGDIGRRRARRRAITAQGSYRTGAGTARPVELCDVSEIGCRFVDPKNRLYVGTQLVVKVATLGPFDAVVAWMDGVSVGVRFNQPIYGPLLDHLCDQYMSQPNELERRRMARP